MISPIIFCLLLALISYARGLGEIPESYVLLYTLNSEQELLDRASKIAERLCVPIVCLHCNTKKFKNMLNVRDVGPSTFLKLVRGAAFICTDSFHGACFSINFNKPFVVKTSESSVQSNIRITDLLSHYELESSLFSEEFVCSTNMEFDRANSILAQDREAARSFITACIGW